MCYDVGLVKCAGFMRLSVLFPLFSKVGFKKRTFAHFISMDVFTLELYIKTSYIVLIDKIN